MTFVAAVPLNAAGQPVRLKLHLFSSFSSEAIAKGATASLLLNATVLSVGLACFAAVAEVRRIHTPRVVGALKPRALSEFKWINSLLGNLKTTLAGAFKALIFGKYAQAFRAAFAYRFNHRFNLSDLIAVSIDDVAQSKRMPEQCVRGSHAEAGF